ncbi:MAG: hypothetical protein ACRC8S_13195 [Fimbriiglobus sp.]
MRLFLAFFALTSLGYAQDLERPPIRYSTAAPANAVSRWEEANAKAELPLRYRDGLGYLPDVLKALDVPVSSQMLVFTRTSLQRSRISPRTPRAIYFNDEVSVGFCRNGDVLEIAATDDHLGTVFYTIDQSREERPKFVRQTETCLICHGSSRNQGFPGHLHRSVWSDTRGEPIFSRGTKTVDQTTAIQDRWGGWYVTGKTGQQTHMGNQVIGGWAWQDPKNPIDFANVLSLKRFFTAGSYLSEHSDVVALMVHAHQGEAHNRLTRAGFQTRLALHEQAELNKALGEKPNTRLESITRRIGWACEPVVEYFFFCDEAEITEPITGSTTFAEEFQARGPFDSKKRSLRELDLKKRLFRYPLSYTIYGRAFHHLPTEAKDRIWQRLNEILTGQDKTERFSHITPTDRQAIREILIATHPEIPASWK